MNQAKKILNGLGFDNDMRKKLPMNFLQGGEDKAISAKALFMEPEILYLMNQQII